MNEEKELKIEYTYRKKVKEKWFIEAEEWAKKQIFPFNILATGLVVWLKGDWDDGKMERTIQNVDQQVEKVLDQWEKEDPQPEITTTKSEVENLDAVEIKSPWWLNKLRKE